MPRFENGKPVWYAPHEIRYSVEQVKWLISILPSLREGNWPPDPRETGYNDRSFTTRQWQRHAPFETACMIAGEVDARLKACGWDGLLVKSVYCWGEDYQSLGISEEELYRRCGRCLEYVSGWKRKNMSYKQWVKQRDYRRRKNLESKK
jgi:hypothetical protein